MNTFETVAAAAKAALNEINRANAAEGFAATTDLTGKTYLDLGNEAVWFQVEDSESHTTNWVSLDFPELAAPGEKAVVATDEDDMRNFEENRNPVALYSVKARGFGETHEEVLYSRLSWAEAVATLASCYDMGAPGEASYYIDKE